MSRIASSVTNVSPFQSSFIIMSDWDTVTIIRGKNAIRGPGAAKSSAAVNAARRRGEPVTTEEKYGGGGNKQHGTQLNTMKLDQETEELKHNTVSSSSLEILPVVLQSVPLRLNFVFSL